MIYIYIHPLVNKQLDPENKQFLTETNLPTPMNGRVYVKLLKGTCDIYIWFGIFPEYGDGISPEFEQENLVDI